MLVLQFHRCFQRFLAGAKARKKVLGTVLALVAAVVVELKMMTMIVVAVVAAAAVVSRIFSFLWVQ